ncbi:NERD domain-containing protein [Huintestinicola butyrica]|uniref:nuclease-related domain-containing DEAD/DEAH box helicase n=1 Tax=Huintestinicola butyrica TaxID=2981728 RepID=UPI003F7E2557
MAIMCPEQPKEFSPASLEGMMFKALSNLPDSYYVFHSFSIVQVIDDVIHESETDFVIFNRKKGILCLEAKAGRVKYSNGAWRYGSGRIMSHDGPFMQAQQNKYKLKKYLEDKGFRTIIPKCKMLHAVWFPSIDDTYLDSVDLPPDTDRKLILTQNSMDNIEEAISKIFDLELKIGITTALSKADEELIINKVLAPEFDLISISELKHDHSELVFKQMLKEQVALLNYLDEQNNAVINGMAGTGKTVIAIEKAKRHAISGEKVLFLCYNAFLKEHLRTNYLNKYISFYTIDGLACKLCHSTKADYQKLKNVLEEMYFNNSFPYDHIIIDEGQDFGRGNICEAEIIELLKSNVVDDGKHGTFYIFYDKNQLIQSEKIPNYIMESDCKLTLYRNCRNTQNIAMTSMRLLGLDKQPKVAPSALVGDSPEMFFVHSTESLIITINDLLDSDAAKEYPNITILTCKTEKSSMLKEDCLENTYLHNGKSILFTTCRKFKGLESDMVILIDIGKEELMHHSEELMYVGSSRAKYKLILIATLEESEYTDVLTTLSVKKTRNPEKAIATSLNAKHKEVLLI